MKPADRTGNQRPNRESNRPRTKEDYIRNMVEEDPKKAAEIIREILKKIK